MDDVKIALEDPAALASHEGEKPGLVAPALRSLDKPFYLSGVAGRDAGSAVLPKQLH